MMLNHALWTAILLCGILVSGASADLVGEVRSTDSGPVLYVNGEPRTPTFFYVSLWHDPALTEVAQGEIRSAGASGVDIISFAIWGLPWFLEGEPVDYSKLDVDVWVEKVLTANPNALLLPRFPTDWPPEAWREAHPEDVMLFADGKRDGPASIHSVAWREDAAKQVAGLVQLLESKYGDRIIGYHPCGQTSAEWFYEGMWDGRLSGFEGAARDGFRRFLRTKYGSDDALRRAWRRPGVTRDAAPLPTADERTKALGAFRDPSTQQAAIDFDEFQNVDMADAVARMCRAVKDAAPDKLAVAFYGYQFELAGAPNGLVSSGHLGLSRLLESPDVDVLCSPVAYGDRQPGGGGFFMSPVDSVLRHGKLWLIEDDTRTHLSDPDAFPGRCSDARETMGVLTRNFAHILSRGAAVWWMDIGGRGWFAGDDTWQGLAPLGEAYAEALPELEPYEPEIAVIIDERSILYSAPSPVVTASLMDAFRRQWYRIGAPVGIYLLDDLVAGRVPPARMYVFVNTFRIDEDQLAAIRRQVCRDGRVAVWMYAPGIVRDDKLTIGHVGQVACMDVDETQEGDGNLILASGDLAFVAGHPHLEPMLEVSDPAAHPLAWYASGGDVAIGKKNMVGWTSVYCGTLQMPTALLRDLAEEAGVHIYTDGDDIIAVGNGFVSIHASSAGVKTLYMPRPCRLVDIRTGESLDAAATFHFPMQLGDTRLFRATVQERS